MRFSLYILFKNCSNLSLNSSGAYLYGLELMLSVLGFYIFLLILTSFLVRLKSQKHVGNWLNCILIVIRLCLLCSITFHSIEGILFPLFPCIRAVSFTPLLICFNILYPLGWVLYVSCSKFVTNLSQESLCLLLSSLLASAVFLFYSSLSSSFLQFSHFYVFFPLFLLIVLFLKVPDINNFIVDINLPKKKTIKITVKITSIIRLVI